VSPWQKVALGAADGKGSPPNFPSLVTRPRYLLTGTTKLDQPWLANRNMDEASRRIEESDIRNSGNRPLIAYLARANIDFD
jgi:hypothetical protein